MRKSQEVSHYMNNPKYIIDDSHDIPNIFPWYSYIYITNYIAKQMDGA